MDGLPALELWDLIVFVLGNVSRVSDRSGQAECDDHKHHKSHKKIDVMKDIDAVPSNVQSAREEALLYVFEDNEAVIKMIIKGRSPAIRHVSRTHRVALDWLFDRINLDSKIQIKYIDTENQLADILTKGNFTRDEWNHLLNLFNISHFSSQSKEKTRSRSQTTLCIRSEKEKISTKSMNGKLIRPSEERECAQHKLYEGEQTLRRAIGRRQIPTAHFRRSIKNLNLNDFSYTKQLDGQIGLRGTRLACVENEN